MSQRTENSGYIERFASSRNIPPERNKHMSIEYYQPQDAYESSIARTILANAWREHPDLVDGVAGVEIVAPYTERPEGEDCVGYVLGSSEDALVRTRQIMDTWEASVEPTSGAIAVYLSDGYPMHLGKVVEDGRVVSKWTTNLFESGHVYEHLPLAVPDDYGNQLIFYTEPDM